MDLQELLQLGELAAVIYARIRAAAVGAGATDEQTKALDDALLQADIDNLNRRIAARTAPAPRVAEGP